MENILTYEGYYTAIKYDADRKILYGKIEGIQDLITLPTRDS